MATVEAYQMSAGEAARAIGDGLITPSALIEACLERVATREARVHLEGHRLVDAAGHEIERSEVRLPGGPIRMVGEHHVTLHLHADVDVELPVTVVAEE